MPQPSREMLAVRCVLLWLMGQVGLLSWSSVRLMFGKELIGSTKSIFVFPQVSSAESTIKLSLHASFQPEKNKTKLFVQPVPGGSSFISPEKINIRIIQWWLIGYLLQYKWIFVIVFRKIKLLLWYSHTHLGSDCILQ